MATPAAYAVLLRGVNLGPHRRVSAADLRAAASDAGFADAATYANSGNLVVGIPSDLPDEGRPPTTGDVAARITDALEARIGIEVPMVAIDDARLAAIVAANPFPAAARDDPSHLLVHVGPAPVDADEVARLDLAHPGRELLAVAEGVLYVHYVDGIGTSKLGSVQIDRASGTWTTGRNWNTIQRLLQMVNDR
jgi:uncharacterized protein (DUF1697 family)